MYWKAASGKRATGSEFTGQLIDAESGAHIWADRFDRDLTDIFAVQDELTQEIISALKIKLTPETRERLARKGTVNEEVYDLFLRGREQAWLTTKSGNIEARKLLGQAIAIKPDFAAAHAIFGFTYVNGYRELARPRGPSGRSKPGIATRAVQMDETEPQCHYAFAIALIFHRQHDRALAEARRSVALEPNFAQGHQTIARMLTFSGDAAGAIKMLEAYMLLDPIYRDLTLYFLAEARVALGQFDAAVAALKQQLARNPNSATSWALLASCYGYLGRFDEARRLGRRC